MLPHLKIFLCTIVFSGTAFATAEQTIDFLQYDIARRFVVRPQGLVLDYSSADGTVQLPGAEDCLLGRPNALSWWTPLENGPFLSGLYLDGVLARWLRTRSEPDLKLARDLAAGLMGCASVSSTPGFIARGFYGEDRKYYAIGSDDQTAPWFYGLWRYIQSDAPTPEERAAIAAKMIEVATALKNLGWNMPCAPVGTFPAGQARGGWNGPDFRGASRLLFVAKIIYELTGEVSWKNYYDTKLNEVVSGSGGKTRRTIIQEGMAGEWATTPSVAGQCWIYIVSQGMLNELWMLETLPELRTLYHDVLQANALVSAPKITDKLPYGFSQAVFRTDWQTMNSLWRVQNTPAQAATLAAEQIQAWGNSGRSMEIIGVRDPFCAAWVMSFAPDSDPILTSATGRFAQLLGLVPWATIISSHGIYAESAWYQMNRASVALSTELFRDDFDNGVVNNSNAVAGFWTSSLPVHATMVESAGKITISAGAPASPHGTIAAYLLSGAPASQFNFLQEKLHFSSLFTVSGTAPAAQNVFRFALTSAAGSSYATDDALSLMVRGDNLFSFSVKQNRPYFSPEGVTKLVESNAGAAIIGFDLTLDATTYKLILHRQGATSLTFTGAHGIVAAQWGITGNSAFLLETVRATGSAAGAGQTTVVNVDSLSVHRIGEPPPIVGASTNYPPEALFAFRSAASNTVLTSVLGYATRETDLVSFSLLDTPMHGTLALDACSGAYSYRPAHAFAGTDGFIFTVSDGYSAGAAAVRIEITPPPDSDGDGMPNSWESSRGVSDPALDEDQDGFSNLQEYLAGTDPKNSADALRVFISASEGGADGFRLTWPAKGGVRYRVQYGDTLASFTDLVRPVADEIQPGGDEEPGTASFFDDYSLTGPSSSGGRFYRVSVIR